ncbi:MAG: polysaccharide deacetylase family protein [Rubrivivax sp.]
MAAAVYDPLLRAGLRLLSPPGAAGRLSIVIFHRVLAQADPLFPGDPDAPHFDAICRWLASWFRVLPLDEATDRLARGGLPPRAACITFDDGYADNHDLAMPILRRHGLTATFFIATGFLDGGRMWNDTVVESLRRCRADRLDVSGLGLPRLSLLDLGGWPARRAAMRQLLGAIKYLGFDERQACVDRLAALAGAALPHDLMMRSEQLKAMASAGMQIGAHTVSHPILARLDAAQAEHEIASNKAELESRLQQPVRLFAYPNGKPGDDYLPRDVETVRRLGFSAAVSTSPGAARSGAGLRLHELPRFTPWDTQRLRFGLRLARNLAGV